MKKQILTAIAIGLGAVSFSAQGHAADDRISLYEVKSFIGTMDHAINNRDITAGREFLNMKLANRGTFNETIYHDWSSQNGGHYVVNGTKPGTFYSYRYPRQSNAYNRTSAYTMTKTDILKRFETKKRTIPGYAHSVNVLGIDMDASAQQAVADIVIKEFGAYYTPQAAGYIGQHVISESRCKASLLRGRSGDLIMTGMNCNTTGHYPI